MTALTLRNTTDLNGREEREQEYLRVIIKYDKSQVEKFPQLLSLIILELEAHPRDVLGELYMALGLGAKELGQCFTPWGVAELLAGFQDSESLHQTVDKNGFVALAEPCCGAGAMAIASMMHLRTIGINPQRQAHMSAEDISLTAVHMAFIQLALLGIPAVVYHRDTLTRETFSVWQTPWHILGGWNRKIANATKPAQADQLAH
ncbi:N-6 DNA methylase [Glutamicibacter ardleyensis]|uniref:N-6 DNA methylase n=1 Tax=Glutamicibacter ardleyensis TaxID=225894 RepID=UPI003FCF8D7F